MTDSWNFDYPKIARESGFHFQQYNDGIFDWRLIGSIEVERILHNQNIEKLDNVIQHLSEAPLGALLQNQILESGVAKYFILSQLAIQYLLFCKKFLDETLTSVRDSLQELQSENLRLTKLHQDNSNELLQLHKELQQMKAISEIVYPCSMCTKNFISNEMLKVHFARKHTTEMPSDKKSSDKDNDRNLISTIKLELEIKHLKERLNDAEKQFRKCNNFVDDQQAKKSIIISPRSEVLSATTTDRDRDNFKNVGIQSEIVRQFDKSIQSNLTEDKETDDIVQFEQNQILEGFTKLSIKIENLEKNKEIEQQNNKNSLVKIEEKLMEVKQDLEAKSLRENDILNNVASQINTISSSKPENNSTADIEKMKEYLSNTVAKIQEQNIDQMTKVAEKIDLSCSEKLLNLRKDIESLGLLKSVTEQKVKLGKTKTDIFNLPMPIIKDIDKREIIKRVEKKPVVMPLEIDDSESCSELSSAATNSEISEYEVMSLKEVSKPKTYLPTKSIIKSTTQQIQPVLARSDLRKEVIKMKKKCLKSLGITSSTTSLPSNSVPEIMSILTQKRMSTKKKFPNFYATRNQIKKTIENISINKKNDLKVQHNINKDNKKGDNEVVMRSQELEQNDGYEYSSPRPVKNDKDVKSDRILSSRENKTKINESTDEFSDQINSFKSKKEFNAKLEHLLSSPIRKLAEIHKKDVEYSTEADGATSAERNTADNLIKPVPAPRKKIMFDLENYSNSMDSSSDDIQFK